MDGGAGAKTSAVRRLYAGWTRLINVLAGSSMAVVVVVMTAQVIARYVFNSSLIWAEEFCRYILVWQTFLFIGVAYQRGELIAVDIVPLMLSPAWRFALKVVVTIPVLIFLWLMVTNGYAYAARFQHQNLPALDFIWMSIAGREANISVFWVYVSVAVGSGLLALHMVASLVVDAIDLAAGRGIRDPRSTEALV